MPPQPPTAAATPGTPRLEPTTRVALLSAGMAIAAAGLLTSFGPWSMARIDHPGPVAAMLVAFAVAERTLLYLQFKDEAVSYTPSEVLIAIGLFFLNPYELLAARMIGAGIGNFLSRRPPPIKMAFHAAQVAVEVSLAAALFSALQTVVSDGVLGSWISVVVSLIASSVMGGLLVTVAIAQFEGGLVERLRHEIFSSAMLYLPVIGVGASLAVPMTVDPQLGLVAAVPGPIIWLVLHFQGSLRHQHADLVGVHDFSRLLGESTSLPGMAATSANQISLALRADNVAMRIWTETGELVDATTGNADALLDQLPKTIGDVAWQPVLGIPRALRETELPPTLWARFFESGTRGALVAPITDESGALGLIVVTGRRGPSPSFDDDDISRLTSMTQQLSLATRKERLRTQMEIDATHDRLTSLPNRGHFEHLVNSVGGAGGHGAVFLLDLDRFKQVNDTFGHPVGDLLLIEAARRIGVACVIDDAVARFGGDEFAVFMEHVSADEAQAVATSITDWLERSFEIEQAKISVGASIGIAMMPEHGRDASTLIRRADIAMYDAKTRRARISLYDPNLDREDTDRSTLLNDLRTALREHQITAHFQPQVDIATRRVSGAEALARWEHPTRGRVHPGDFIEVAEQAGLIEELTNQVLNQACEAAARWEKLGVPIDIAVNISPRSLLDGRVGSVVERALAATTIDPRRLVLEITESTSVVHDERSHGTLRALSELGVQLSIDDFGTGFSSLVNLRRLRVNEIKIDRSFVSSMLTEHDDETIVRSTIELGHNLGLSVVAEGVENVETFDRLAAFGCDIAQGFGISRPLPADEFEEWLLAQQAGPAGTSASAVGEVVHPST